MFAFVFPQLKFTIIVATFALTVFCHHSQAALSSYSANGKDLVYSSESNVTWTKDGNLLSSLFASQGFNNVVNAILAVSPTSSYTLTTSDFSSNGQTTWFGAMAFVSYLNSIHYAGSNQWRLPTFSTQIAGFNTPSNGRTAGNELSELFYQELSGTEGSNIPNTTSFYNEQAWAYWSATEYSPDPNYAWAFATYDGLQYEGDVKDIFPFYVWAVSPGQIAAVPEPERVIMLLLGLGFVGGLVRCRK